MVVGGKEWDPLEDDQRRTYLQKGGVDIQHFRPKVRKILLRRKEVGYLPANMIGYYLKLLRAYADTREKEEGRSNLKKLLLYIKDVRFRLQQLKVDDPNAIF